MKNPFVDSWGLTGTGLVCAIFASLFGVVLFVLGCYYVTGYPVDKQNCEAAGGHWVNGVLGGCVYPQGDNVRVHVNKG